MFTEKKWEIPTLNGISAKNIEEHLKLYSGYVKFANLAQSKIAELISDTETNAYQIGELNRRFSFEYNGMRNHEAYFSQFEIGPKEMDPASRLAKKINSDFGSYDDFIKRFKTTAMTRGVGWCMLGYDDKSDKLLIFWIDEQHLGQLQEVKIILALDMWEHAYVYDFPTSAKKDYIKAFLSNVNWEVVSNRFN